MSVPVATELLPPDAGESLDISFESDALSVLERNFALHGDAFRIFSPALQRDLWVGARDRDLDLVNSQPLLFYDYQRGRLAF